jgi:TrmH family RNA methyltransferase
METDLFKGLAFTEISEAELGEISHTVNPQGIVFLVEKPKLLSLNEFRKEDPFLLALDRIRDPGNMGTIIRTARSVSLKNIFISSDCAEPFSEKVIRSAAASQFALNIFSFDDLNNFILDVSQIGYEKIYLTAVAGGVSVFKEEKLFDRSTIVIGNEASGISSFQNGCKVSIPMPGKTESLNAAQAASIILFEAVRRGIL